MLYLNGYDIRIPLGDSADIAFAFLKQDDTPYIFGNGEFARLTVTHPQSGEVLLVKETSGQDEHGIAVFSLSPGETEDIGRGTYLYTVKLLTADGCVVNTVHGFPGAAGFTVG